jgi:uncharacterized integral membrane protein (TIGR00697 family)
MNISYRFVVIASLFVTCLITGNILIVKQVGIGPFTLPAGIIIFPLSYILGDVLTEVYGYKKARSIIWLGFLCNLVAVAAFWIGGLLPAAPTFEAQEAYQSILGSTPRFLLASFIAYTAGEFSNSYVLAKMKIATKGRWLWTRTIGSTIIGQGIDSVIALSIAFAGVLPTQVLVTMVLSHWLAKTVYETAVTPLTYLVVGYFKRKENSDVYDYNTNFNPLHIG